MDSITAPKKGLEPILLLLAFLGLAWLGYAIPRADFTLFITVYSVLFGLYFYWCQQSNSWFQERNWKHYFAAAILLRLVFLFAYPALSDDFWRYLWDGRLASFGISPYQFLPSELLQQPIFEQAHLAQIYPHLNSPNFYSVYPPVQQAIFCFANFFFTDNLTAALCLLHLVAIALDMGIIILLLKCCELLKKSANAVFFYAFNPMIIIELHGNLHTEITMMFFLVLALYFILQKRHDVSAIGFSLAVGAKFLPLMLLPLLLRRLWFWKGVKYCLIVAIINLFLLLPFFDIELLQKIQSSMQLYFTYFEFNACIYYLVRYGIIHEYWWIWDYHHEYFLDKLWIENALRKDWYAVWRSTLPIITLAFILLLSFWQNSTNKNTSFFLRRILFIYTCYILFSTTVHPWYISPLLLLAVLTPYRYPMFWSYLIGWTYIAYRADAFQENFWIIGIEYLLVIALLAWEWRAK